MRQPPRGNGAHYLVTMVWRDGRTERQAIWAPNDACARMWGCGRRLGTGAWAFTIKKEGARDEH